MIDFAIQVSQLRSAESYIKPHKRQSPQWNKRLEGVVGRQRRLMVTDPR